MKKLMHTVITLCCILIMYIALHSTPTIVLRTHLFMSGHPIIAFTTGIMDDDLDNNLYKKIYKSQNAKCYYITKPPIYKPTQSKLGNYKVTKSGFLFFAVLTGGG